MPDPEAAKVNYLTGPELRLIADFIQFLNDHKPHTMRLKTAKEIIRAHYGSGELETHQDEYGIWHAEIHGYKAVSTFSRTEAIKNLAKKARHDKKFQVEVI